MKKLILLSLVCSVLQGWAQSNATELKVVGKRGWYTTAGAVAAFDPNHRSVNLWLPKSSKKAPIVVYAHGGAGFREDDSTRIALLQRNGFATLSFDAYEMNGLDWSFVTRRVTNTGKQNLISGVLKGALAYAQQYDGWDMENIFLYGASNGGRSVLYAGSSYPLDGVRGIIAEAPAATGYELGDIDIPTIVLFGKKDNWAGTSDTDYVWTRTYPSSPVSILDWVTSQNEKKHPVSIIFYEEAGHLMFEGPLEKVTVRRGDKIAFKAYQGANAEALKAYEYDVNTFIKKHVKKK